VFYALRFYALALISQSMLEVVVRAFAAQQDTYTPLFVSVFTTALNIGLAIWWSQPFARGGIEHGGPALANGVAVLVEAMIGLTILHIRWKGVDARRIIADSLKALAAAGVLAGVVLGFKALIGESLLLIVLGGGLGMVAYFIVAFTLGIKEIRDIPLGLINNAKPIGKRT
jgi:putative peptidoglycan lipid II flippase